MITHFFLRHEDNEAVCPGPEMCHNIGPGASTCNYGPEDHPNKLYGKDVTEARLGFRMPSIIETLAGDDGFGPPDSHGVRKDDYGNYFIPSDMTPEEAAVYFKDAGLARPPALTFAMLRRANQERLPDFNAKYTGDDHADWTPADWTVAACGELGEFANLLKKRRRGEDISTEDLAKELADTVTYLDFVAWSLGIDLGEATRAKFNEVSERIGSAVRL